MRNSFLVRRFFILLVVAVILWTALTAVFYSFIAQPVFARIKVKEITPRIKVISQRVAGSTDYDRFVTDTVSMSYSLFGNWIFLVDSQGIKLHTDLQLESEDTEDKLLQNVHDSHMLLISSEEEVMSKIERISGIKGSLIFVSVPIQVADQRYGSVVAVQPMQEMNASILSLNMALLISSLVVLLIMTVPVLIAAFRIVRPLQSIRKVALAISGGDFTQRAVEDEEGEIGDLGRAMNELSSQLSHTFSELRVERNRLRQILDGIQEGIIAVDRGGIVTHSNTAVWDVFGIKGPDLKGLTPDEFLRTSRLDNFFSQAMLSRKIVHVVISKDHRQIDCIITPLETGQHLIDGAVGLFRDVTEAERLEMTRRDYVANISHELRTPLTAMRGLLEPLSEGMVKSEQDRQRYYDILMRETRRLSRLINDMLELSRIQAEEVEIEQQAFSIDRMLSDLIFRFKVTAEENNITLTLENEKPLPEIPQVWGNPDRVEQILVILLDNAIKYTPDGGDIVVKVAHQEQKLGITVHNSGPGIKAEDIDHVFDRFFKADRSHTQPGTGLGLSIAKELANIMGHELDVHSEPGQGADFILLIPYANLVRSNDEELKEVFSALPTEDQTGEDDQVTIDEGANQLDVDTENGKAAERDSTGKSEKEKKETAAVKKAKRSIFRSLQAKNKEKESDKDTD
ncbi:MAG TPA: cell wall metabolism sensor histidine kinase WalK [Clostridiaceae bacterium]|nr:cell wall metabolism sensor histidine kinase WalK [Clostridiaceae bacterium]